MPVEIVEECSQCVVEAANAVVVSVNQNLALVFCDGLWPVFGAAEEILQIAFRIVLSVVRLCVSVVRGVDIHVVRPCEEWRLCLTDERLQFGVNGIAVSIVGVGGDLPTVLQQVWQVPPSVVVAAPECVEAVGVAVGRSDERCGGERSGRIPSILKSSADRWLLQAVVSVEYLLWILPCEKSWDGFTGMAADAVRIREDGTLCGEFIEKG